MIKGHTIDYNPRNGLSASKPYRYRGIPGWDPAAVLAATSNPSPSGNPAIAKPPPQCGTLAGYSRHQRRHETACEPCRAAHSDWDKAYKKAKRASRGDDA